MISQSSLLKALDDDLRVCVSADHSSDLKGRERQATERLTLQTYLTWARRVGENQDELEEIVQSLEADEIVVGHQHWRELAANRLR
jgi:hypothetical protein